MEQKYSIQDPGLGKIIFSFNRVHWKIPDFYNLLQENSNQIKSPCFSSCNRDWRLLIQPDGSTLSSSGWFKISITNENFASGVRDKVKISVGISGTLHNSIPYTQAKSTFGHVYRICKFIQTSVLNFQKQYMVPDGNLHLFCDIQLNTKVSTGLTTKLTLQKGIKKLQENLLEIYQNGDISDVVIIIDGKEFKSHRSILAARSPVFRAMFMHDTKERATGVVNIQDIEVDIFSEFLKYLYTGCMKSVSPENTHKVYIIADRYQVLELKRACVQEMLKKMYSGNFCDVFGFSLQCKDNELIEGCTDFFMNNALSIIKTSEWVTFFTENPNVSNDLLIKHVQNVENRLNISKTAFLKHVSE